MEITQLRESGKVSNFVFSKLFKDFKSSNDSLFVFDNVSLTLQPGSKTTSTFKGDLRMTGFLAPFKTFLSSSDALTVTASLETTVGLTQKISPNKLTLSGIVPFHIPLFNGVTLTKVTLQVAMVKNGDSWTFTPTLIGILDVDGITDTDTDKIKLQVSLENGTLKLSAEGKNINGPFGLSQLMLDQISIKGSIGTEKQLAITTRFDVGTTIYNFSGVITPTAIGMIASAKGFTLNELANVFVEISPGNLKLPDFGVTFNNTSIAFASTDCTVGSQKLQKGLTLITDLTAHGHTLSTTAQISPEGVAFGGAIGNLEIGPVTINKAGLKFQIYKRATGKPSLFNIYGEAEIQKVTVDVGVYFEKQVSSWVTVLYASIAAKSISLSTFFPDTKGSVMDDLSLSKMSFIFATADCKPKKLASVSSVKKGLQLIAVVKKIPGLSELTKQENMNLNLTAHLGSTMDISIALPGTRLELGNSVKTDNIKIAIFIAPKPRIALIFGMEVSIPNQQQPLHFDMMLDMSPTSATGSVTMKNYWRNPFGVNGLKIGPAVALQLGIEYVPFSSTGIPTVFGLAGGLAIGDTTLNMAAKIATNPMDIILRGSLKELDLKEVVVFATDTVGLNIPEKDIPDFLDIKNLEFYVAPAGGSIGTITYKRGLSFACDMAFMEKKFQFYTHISENGIEGAGKLDKVEIGPLKVSGAKGDDASVSLALTPSKQSFNLDGAISFLGAKKSAFVAVSTKGIEFKFEENFFNLLKFEVEGKSSGSITNPASLDFQLAADMKNDITGFLKNTVSKKIDEALNTATKGIDTAKKAVSDAEHAYRAEYDKAKKALDDAQGAADDYLKQLNANVEKARTDYLREVGKAQAELDKAQEAYNKAFNDAKNAVTVAERNYNSGIASAKEILSTAEHNYNSGIRTAQAAVSSAQRLYNNAFNSAQNWLNSKQRTVDSLLGEIRRLERQRDSRGWLDPRKIGDQTQITGLWLAHKGATGLLNLAKDGLEGVRHGGLYTAFEAAKRTLHVAKTSGVEHVAFTAAKTALHVAETGAVHITFESAKKTLETIQYGTQYTAWEAAKKTLSAAKEVSNLAIRTANQAVLKVGSSAQYIALNVAKTALSGVENGTSAAAFSTAKTALEAAKTGATAVLGLAAYVAKHQGDILDVKSMHISGSLKGLEKGDLFKAKLKVAVLSTNHDWDVDLNIKDVTSFIDKMFEMVFAKAKTIAGL